ncbi:MAG: tetratricopeptide repeat protein [Vampirovibrionales bacterium]|nr:tetratricopeptide repeat protein [Vampirovibrionales bacterium]
MVTRIYTPPVMSYYRAQQLQANDSDSQASEKANPEQATADEQESGQALVAHGRLAGHITQKQAPSSADSTQKENTQNDDISGRTKLSSIEATGRISVNTILDDFQSTLNALGADQNTQAEVSAYLGIVKLQAEKDRPDTSYIKHSLKTAAGVMDGFITDTLKQPSKVVRDWVDALLLQPIEFKWDKSSAKSTPEEQAAFLTQTESKAADAPNDTNHELRLALKQALKDSKAAYQAGNTENARQILEAASRHLQTNDRQVPGNLSGRVSLQLARLYNEDHQFTKAIPHFQAAIGQFQAISLKSKLAQSHLGLAEALEPLGQMEEAIKHYQNTMAIAEGNNNEASLQSAAQNGLGGIYLQSGQYNLAVEQFLGAYQSAQRSAGGENDLPDILSNLASTYQRQGNMSKAEQAYRLALKYAKKGGHLDSYRATLGQLANLYDSSHQPLQYEKAMARLSSLTPLSLSQ